MHICPHVTQVVQSKKAGCERAKLWRHVFAAQSGSPCCLSEVCCAFASKDMLSRSAVVAW